MSLPEANTLTSLIATVCYTLLLIITFTRRSQQEKQTRWLLLFLVLSIIWEFTRFFAPPESAAISLSAIALIINVITLGIATAVYASWPHQRLWLVLSGTLLAATIASSLFLPNQTINLNTLQLPPITLSYLITITSWFILALYLLLRTWSGYRHTQFPWHANRLLFWGITLLVTFIGESLLFFNWSGLIIAGQITRFIGVIGLVYAVSSYLIFDVRTRFQRGLAFIFVTFISALPLIAAVVIVQSFGQQMSWDVATVILLTAVVITLGIFLNQPFQRLLERFVARYLLGEAIDTNKVVRSYSQAISRTLDVQQLSIVIIGTLNELLGTSRGALMLVTREADQYTIAPIPGMGDTPRRSLNLALDSIFIQALIQKHQPLLQYELDFNPNYTNLTPDEKEWLQELSMEAFVPVITDRDLDGLITIGPKRSALPYQPSELELLQVLADQTVVALQNARLFSELGTQNEQIQLLNTDLISQNERLEIMDRVKSDFITIASHELRTPLTQVKGYSDILAAMNEENALTREQTREIVGHINRATLQLERLITAMLDASQLDVDGMQLTFVQTKLDMIVKLAMEPLAQALKERRITIEVCDLEILPPIYADFKRLVQAFQNLIGNAVKYTPDHGNITIDATLLNNPNGSSDHIEMVIADTGIGIDPQFHELIFEKFFRIGDPQLHSTGSTKFKGAGPGLGLPIAKGVIEAHDGRIWVESEGEDEKRLPGSRFYIILPVRPSGVQTATSQPASRPSYLVG
ncbi:MAG: GAF domain-containing protein [Ardenticatenaceae bacterium]|nr:GAF domain-containing protein [Ardenticatenaceae bacterium]